jgi:hypothetical protein
MTFLAGPSHWASLFARVAPSAGIEISPRVSFQGCVGGRSITMQPDVTVSSGGVLLPASTTM